jgi:membrane-associated phospholipid phosphatase
MTPALEPPIAGSSARRTAASFASAAGGCWLAFALLTWLVVTMPASLASLDLRIDAAIHDVALDLPWAVNLSLALELIGGVPASIAIVSTVTVLLLATGGGRRPWGLRTYAAGLLVLSAAGGALINTLVKNAVDRARPPWNGVWTWEDSASYPSGHAQAGITVWVALGLIALVVLSGSRRRVVALPLLLLGPVIGLSRTFLGVHWPSDVMGGWLLGGAWLATCVVVVVALAMRSSGSRADPTLG